MLPPDQFAKGGILWSVHHVSPIRIVTIYLGNSRRMFDCGAIQNTSGPQSNRSWPKDVTEASLPCPPEVATWWKSLREQAKRCKSASGDDWGGLRKRRERFLDLLLQGISNSYRPPIQDTKYPVILSKPRPQYTDQARSNGIRGVIIVSGEFRFDGTLGNPRLVRGLGFGLDEKAIEAAKLITFLPAIQDGEFVSKHLTVEMEFRFQ